MEGRHKHGDAHRHIYPDRDACHQGGASPLRPPTHARLLAHQTGTENITVTTVRHVYSIYITVKPTEMC